MLDNILFFFGIKKVYNTRVSDLRRLRKYQKRVEKSMRKYLHENPSTSNLEICTMFYSGGTDLGIERIEKITKRKI